MVYTYYKLYYSAPSTDYWDDFAQCGSLVGLYSSLDKAKEAMSKVFEAKGISNPSEGTVDDLPFEKDCEVTKTVYRSGLFFDMYDNPTEWNKEWSYATYCLIVQADLYLDDEQLAATDKFGGD